MNLPPPPWGGLFVIYAYKWKGEGGIKKKGIKKRIIFLKSEILKVKGDKFMKENKLEQILDKDDECRKFWETLPEGLQNRLSDNADGFLYLKKCVDSGISVENVHETKEDFDFYNPAVSATDATGLIPTGENLTPQQLMDYRGIYNIGNPPSF